MINDCNNIPRHPWQHAYDMISWLYAHLAMQKIHDTLAFPEIVFGQAHLSIFSVTECMQKWLPPAPQPSSCSCVCLLSFPPALLLNCWNYDPPISQSRCISHHCIALRDCCIMKSLCSFCHVCMNLIRNNLKEPLLHFIDSWDMFPPLTLPITIAQGHFCFPGVQLQYGLPCPDRIVPFLHDSQCLRIYSLSDLYFSYLEGSIINRRSFKHFSESTL